TQDGADGKPEEQIKARHVLIRTGGESANPFAPPQSPREQASAAVMQEKRDKMLDDIVKSSHVTVAENFQVKAPEAPPQLQMPIPGGAQGAPGVVEEADPAGAAPAQNKPAPPTPPAAKTGETKKP
ncbi:MAG: hypothetical protein ACRD68_05860, partial [Pyrinomonadaceae bacterium]